MKIPFDHSIWTRLYGPYGIRDVTKDLTILQSCWDQQIASDLFWERLQHQDDLYPVTYAAMPWLWHVVRDMPNSTDRTHALMFCSHVVACAHEQHGSVPARFRGLSLHSGDHQHQWLPSLLLSDDMILLKDLEDWFAAHTDEIANTCLEVAKEADPQSAVHLLKAYFCLRSAQIASGALEIWTNERNMQLILEQLPEPTWNDAKAAFECSVELGSTQPKLADFMASWAFESRFSDRVETLVIQRDPAQPSLF